MLDSFMSKMHGNSLLSTRGQFGTVLVPWVNKNDDEECCFLNNLTLINELAASFFQFDKRGGLSLKCIQIRAIFY